MYHKRKYPKIIRYPIYFLFVFFCAYGFVHYTNEHIVRLERSEAEDKKIEIMPAITPTQTNKKGVWRGEASIYSEDGCLGCSKTLTMANGEKFTDESVVVAFNKLPLNTWVMVTNVYTGRFVKAKVADRGGFEKYGRIIDLGKATADLIHCQGLCQVKIEEL